VVGGEEDPTIGRKHARGGDDTTKSGEGVGTPVMESEEIESAEGIVTGEAFLGLTLSPAQVEREGVQLLKRRMTMLHKKRWRMGKGFRQGGPGR
jgi:hypothetical protein